MTIQLLYGGKIFEGRVIYNFYQLTDTILIKFNLPLTANDKDVFLFYRNGEWKDDSHIREKFPDLFAQMQFKLKNVFAEALRNIRSINNF